MPELPLCPTSKNRLYTSQIIIYAMITEQKKVITDYLCGPREYAEGVALYQRYGVNLRLKRQFALEDTAVIREILFDELHKLAGLSEIEFNALPRRAVSRGQGTSSMPIYEEINIGYIPVKKEPTDTDAALMELADSFGVTVDELVSPDFQERVLTMDENADRIDELTGQLEEARSKYAEAPEPVRKMIRFREKYTFLNSPDCPDVLVEALDRGGFSFWTGSQKYRQREGLLIRSKEEFDNYYLIGSHRLFITLLPIIREVQGATVAPVLGKYLAALLTGEDADTFALMKETAARAVALLTMQKAVERLPVEVIPEGIVQVQQSQPIKSRLKAEQSARAAVAASLGADAAHALEYLQQLVAQLDAEGAEVDASITGPIVHSKGMSF